MSNHSSTDGNRLMPKLEIWHSDHTPDNKRPHEISKGQALLTVQDYNASGSNPEAWTAIDIMETYTTHGSHRAMRRSISFTLTATERRQLIDMLTREAGQ